LTTVSLTVTDKHGNASTLNKDVMVSDEIMYTQNEYYKRFTPVGSNIVVDGAAVKTMEAIPYTYLTESSTLFRSSGPESVVEDGILYQDLITGPTRLMLHHKNKTGKNAKLYIIAKNMDTTPAVLRVQSEGIGGPTPFPEIAGKMSLLRYYSSFVSGSASKTYSLAPGESRLLFDSISKLPMRNEDIITFMGDVSSDAVIKYTAILVDMNRNPIPALNNLAYLNPMQSIVRGTFMDSTRVFHYDELVGNKVVKLSLTDNKADPFQIGRDGLLGTPALNSGNYGVLYKLKLNRVAPNTLITFNPRGGLYTGAALVNGQPTSFAHLGKVKVENQSSVLYRTQDSEESVEIWITPSPGSNLPLALLFMPIPEVRH
jgi:hypothetical protein